MSIPTESPTIGNAEQIPQLPPEWPNGRRLSDKIMQVFRYACVMRNYEEARLLLDVCEAAETRRVARFGGDRRQAQMNVEAARRWLDYEQSKPR